jgi:hypothetical protein
MRKDETTRHFKLSLRHRAAAVCNYGQMIHFYWRHRVDQLRLQGPWLKCCRFKVLGGSEICLVRYITAQ